MSRNRMSVVLFTTGMASVLALTMVGDTFGGFGGDFAAIPVMIKLEGSCNITMMPRDDFGSMDESEPSNPDRHTTLVFRCSRSTKYRVHFDNGRHYLSNTRNTNPGAVASVIPGVYSEGCLSGTASDAWIQCGFTVRDRRGHDPDGPGGKYNDSVFITIDVDE
jgi:hypothetical protein